GAPERRRRPAAPGHRRQPRQLRQGPCAPGRGGDRARRADRGRRDGRGRGYARQQPARRRGDARRRRRARGPRARPVRHRPVHGLGGHRIRAARARRRRATPAGEGMRTARGRRLASSPRADGARRSRVDGEHRSRSRGDASMSPSTARRPLIGAASPDHLHVMTFNLRFDGSDTTVAGDPDHWPDRRPHLVELLEQERPTLLGVQEALFSQLPALREALPGHEMIGFGRDGGSAGEHAAVLYDPERLRVREWDQYWLSDTPDRIGSVTWRHTVTRSAVWARLEDLATGRELAMLNTHFDHESAPARLRSAQMLIDLVEGGRLDRVPTLITGDFNSAAHASGAYRALVTDGPF